MSLKILFRWDDDYPTPCPSRRIPADVLPAIEVADTAYRFDHEVKLPAYVTVGIPKAWLVDVARKRIKYHRQPAGAVYAETRILLPGQRAEVDGSAAWIEAADLAGVWE